MKIKKVVVIVICLLMFCIPSVFAGTTILKREEVNENNIKLSLNQTNGYVTSLNFGVKIDGNVKLEKIIWDDSLKADYFKKYTYSEATNTLEIYIVAPNKQNLVNDDLSINIATLVFSTDTNNEVFDVTLSGKDTNIVMMNNYYDKIIENGANNNTNKFIAHKNEEIVTPPVDNNEDNNNENNNNNNNSGNTTTNNNSGNTTNNSNNSTSNNTQNDVIENNVENVDENTNNTIEQEYNNKINDEKQKEESGTHPNLALILICSGVALLCGCIIIVIRVRNKKQ